MTHQKAIRIELDKKVIVLTPIFANELYKHNITNQKIQNQKN